MVCEVAKVAESLTLLYLKAGKYMPETGFAEVHTGTDKVLM
jgi:hypothetical protein